MTFTLAELASATGGRLLGGGELTLDRLVTDSRQAGPGALFVALAGESTDGHLFVDAAVENGASALLLERGGETPNPPRVFVPDTRLALVDFTHHRVAASGCQVFGVTGSVGKTSTKEMLAAALARKFEVLKTEGNLNTYTGFPMTIVGLEPRHQVFVAEYAMSARGEIAFLTRMAPPDVAVVLNVGMSHVGLLGSIDEIAAAKRELVEGLNPDGVAVLNADDARVAAMSAAAPGRVVMYGFAAGAEVTATDVRPEGLLGTEFTLSIAGASAPVRLQVPGEHAVANALAAAAAAWVAGVPIADIAGALSAVPPVSGRLSVRPGRRGSTILDDSYNASPSSMLAALDVLCGETSRPRVAVLGEMLELGDETERAHRDVGREAAGVDFLVAVGEHASEIAAGAREAGLPGNDIAVVADADAAIEAVEPHIDGAVVLVKASRGTALDQVVENLVEP